MAKKNVRKIGRNMGRDDARKWIKRYQKEHPDAVRGWLFGDDIIEKLINYDGCEGIWFFKGINDDGEERLVMYAADEDGNILDTKLKSIGAAAAARDPEDPADDSEMCPPLCPDNF